MPYQALPLISPDPAIMTFWPNPTVDAQAGGGFVAAGFSRNAGSGATMWTTAVGTGTFSMERYRDLLCGRMRGAGANPLAERQLDGFRIRPPLQASVALMAGKTRVPEPFRVWRWSCMFAWESDAAADTQNGIALISDATGTATYPSAAGVGIGFGIQGNGAGGWQYFSKPTVAGGFVDQTALPAAAAGVGAAWSLIDFEIVAATPATDATLRICVNGETAITRSWAAGTQLPVYPTGFVAFRPAVRANLVGTFTNLYLGPHFVMCGRYTLEDVAQLGPFGVAI